VRFRWVHTSILLGWAYSLIWNAFIVVCLSYEECASPGGQTVAYTVPCETARPGYPVIRDVYWRTSPTLTFSFPHLCTAGAVVSVWTSKAARIKPTLVNVTEQIHVWMRAGWLHFSDHTLSQLGKALRESQR
jgi:hypothetical protein